MYKPTKKTLEKLWFQYKYWKITLRIDDSAMNDFLEYEEWKVNACVWSESWYSYVTFTPKNLSQLKALVEMFLTK